MTSAAIRLSRTIRSKPWRIAMGVSLFWVSVLPWPVLGDVLIQTVSLERVVPGHPSCNVIVKVFNSRKVIAREVTVQGRVKLFDAINSTYTFSSEDFGGPKDVGARAEKVFIGRSLVIPPGVAASYVFGVRRGDGPIKEKGQGEPPIHCAS